MVATMSDMMPGPETRSRLGDELYDVSFVQVFIYQLAVCLDILHNKMGFAHRNLCLRNVIVDLNGCVRLANLEQTV
jgi:hypothetical protein